MSAQSLASGIDDSGSSELQGFRRYYRTLREHVWLMVACVVISVGAAAAYVAASPRKYRAQSELLVSPAPPDNATVFGLPVVHSTNDPTRDVLTAASLVTTTQVASAVISALHLNTTPSALLAQIQANPIAQSNLIGVQATASSASQAEQLANAFGKQMIAVRTAAVHAALATIIPGLRDRVAALAPSQRNGPGTLGDRLSQLEQLQSSDDPSLAFVSSAELPTAPFSPRTKLSLAAGLFGGLILGIGAAFAMTALDTRVRREAQLRDLLALPILARIPRVRTAKARPLTPDELPFLALEGYRTLRTMLATRANNEPQAFLVTGSSPSEGKTTTAIGLAVALAQGGARVILIEADLRRPTFSSALGLKPTYGTDQVLIGEVSLARALTPARFDGTPIQVLAAERSGVELADRLSFAVARRLIEDAKKLSDFVVIDSPPLTTVIDALPLAQLADEVLIVARLGQSRLTKLAELAELLRAQGAYPTGIVLIGSDERTASGYGYYAQSNDGEPSGRRTTRSDEPARGERTRT